MVYVLLPPDAQRDAARDAIDMPGESSRTPRACACPLTSPLGQQQVAMRLTRAAYFLGYTLEGDRYLPGTAGCNEVDTSGLLFGVTHLKGDHYLPRRPSEEAPMHQGSDVVQYHCKAL